MWFRKIGVAAGRLMVLIALPFVLVPLFAIASAPPHSSPVRVSIGDSVAILTGPWKFHPGDDPAFAKQGFDGSSWACRT
jgi:hypothetical protein